MVFSRLDLLGNCFVLDTPPVGIHLYLLSCPRSLAAGTGYGTRACQQSED
jgi:hypothetical protein